MIASDVSAAPVEYFFIIAGHATTATSVKILDNKGNVENARPVFQAVGARGEIYSYTYVDFGVLNLDFNDTTNQYFLEWNDGGGAISTTGETLEGGGDIITWCLDSLGVNYDRDALAAAKPLLNEYKFAGYINDIGIKAYEFLQKYVMPFLPCTLANGANGLYPVLDLRLCSDHLQSRLEIEADVLFERISPVEPLQQDIVNDITVQFASAFVQNFKVEASTKSAGYFIGESNEYKNIIQIRATRPNGLTADYEIVSPYAIISEQRYGRRPTNIALEYVHDRDTATKIGLDMMRRVSLPQKKCTYRAAFKFGYLMVGDVITLTDTDIGLLQNRVQIISKRYDGASWLYGILLQDNPIDNIRDSS